MRIDLSHSGFELTKDISSYVDQKIGKLDRMMKRSARRSAHAEVRLIEESGKKNNKKTVEVILNTPHISPITSKVSGDDFFAGIDIVEEKLESQLRTQKNKNLHRRSKDKIFKKLRRG